MPRLVSASCAHHLLLVEGDIKGTNVVFKTSTCNSSKWLSSWNFSASNRFMIQDKPSSSQDKTSSYQDKIGSPSQDKLSSPSQDKPGNFTLCSQDSQASLSLSTLATFLSILLLPHSILDILLSFLRILDNLLRTLVSPKDFKLVVCPSTKDLKLVLCPSSKDFKLVALMGI